MRRAALPEVVGERMFVSTYLLLDTNISAKPSDSEGMCAFLLRGPPKLPWSDDIVQRSGERAIPRRPSSPAKRCDTVRRRSEGDTRKRIVKMALAVPSVCLC